MDVLRRYYDLRKHKFKDNKRGMVFNVREKGEENITVKRRLVSNVIYKQNTHGSTVVSCKRRNNTCDRAQQFTYTKS